MKKLILMLTLSLFSITGIFAQAWTVKVSWDASSQNCDCEGTINSKFVVSLTIIDVANSNFTAYENEIEVGLTESEHVFSVSSVQMHCNDTSLVNTPDYTIYAGVGLKCDETNPPTIVCSDKVTDTDRSCLDFSSAQITENLILN